MLKVPPPPPCSTCSNPLPFLIIMICHYCLPPFEKVSKKTLVLIKHQFTYLSVCYQLERESKVLNLTSSIGPSSTSWCLHCHHGTQLSHRETDLGENRQTGNNNYNTNIIICTNVMARNLTIKFDGLAEYQVLISQFCNNYCNNKIIIIMITSLNHQAYFGAKLLKLGQ